MKLRDISDQIYADVEDRHKMEKMNEIYYEIADYVKGINPEMYRECCEKAEDILYEMSEDEARQIVVNMKPYGEYWNIDTVYDFVKSKGAEPFIDYYLAMNMAFNDYRNTAIMAGMDTEDFYYSIANDFINDQDGVRHKVEKYFREE